MAKCRQIRDQLTTAANVAERKTDTRPGIAKTLERDVPKGHRTGGTRNRTGNETVPLTGETEIDAATILRTDTKTGTTGATGDDETIPASAKKSDTAMMTPKSGGTVKKPEDAKGRKTAKTERRRKKVDIRTLTPTRRVRMGDSITRSDRRRRSDARGRVQRRASVTQKSIDVESNFYFFK